MASPDSSIRLKDVYAHPVGRDAIDKILLQLGRSRRWVTNPLVANLPLRTLGRLAGRFLGPGLAEALLAILAEHPERVVADASAAGSDPPWWQSAVFYQVYPRSFQDSDGDGIGDLRGLIGRLDYLRDLGVDCVWLSPIFDSPNEDMGYDVRDYRAVMTEMGTLADLDELIAGCHERGMRIILDLVVNHTSEQHEWFQAAIADPDGPYGDYYHLRPGADGEDGTGNPPNNWTSFFSGSAWRWIPEAKRWALHLFAPGQMDLNWENPAVRAEVADIVQWWRARGIDGFRMDVINYISKRDGLPDGNEAIGRLMGFFGIENYFFGPRLHEHLHELRAKGFTGGGKPVGVMVGETPGVGIEMGRLLSDPEREELDLVFNFDVLDMPGRIRWDDYRYDLRYLKTFFTELLTRIGPGDRAALFFDNHDNPRMLSKVLGSRVTDPHLRAALAKALATIQLTLRGVPFLFQGQEIGAIDQRFASLAELRDVESLNRHAELRADGLGEAEAFAAVLPGARDHARVPMRWEPGAQGGFTTELPWQAGSEDSTGFTVAEQTDDPDSVWSFHRDLIRLRREHPALAGGGIRFLSPRSRDCFAWVRTADDGSDAWLIEVNLTDRPISRPRGMPDAELVLDSAVQGQSLGPYGARVSRISRPGPAGRLDG
ncbi:alpha-amylase family glycosyl hydrolase [Microbacterium sp.]|uniref:alpha-glucosidase n=1 Tax=Microbacterium sp. TaxID=51671 RepID=UPI003F983D31